jgi:enoyl-CoA hydratase
VTACDIRLCSADAFFLLQEINVGMAADLGSLQRLPKIVPQGVAREMAYTGERVGAERALAIGLVNAVLADADALRDRALALARTIASKSPLAIAGTKLALNHARDHSTASALQQMTLLQSAIFDTGEMATAIAAWKAKGTAEFASLASVARL